MSDATPHVISVNLGLGGIPKSPVDVGVATLDGLEGDDHNHEKHCTPLQGLSILDVEDLEAMGSEGFDLFPGATGENLTCRGLDVDSLEIGDRLIFSGGVVAELTKRRNPCYVLDGIDPALKKAAVGRIGFYARIIDPGTIRAGETIYVRSTVRGR